MEEAFYIVIVVNLEKFHRRVTTETLCNLDTKGQAGFLRAGTDVTTSRLLMPGNMNYSWHSCTEILLCKPKHPTKYTCNWHQRQSTLHPQQKKDIQTSLCNGSAEGCRSSHSQTAACPAESDLRGQLSQRPFVYPAHNLARCCPSRSPPGPVAAFPRPVGCTRASSWSTASASLLQHLHQPGPLQWHFPLPELPGQRWLPV